MIFSGATIDTPPTLVPSTTTSYLSTSDSADSPITSPGTTQCHSPSDQLLNGNVASPPQNGTTANTNVLIMNMDEDPYQIAFKQEPPNTDSEHTF